MNFREIILAAMKEIGGIQTTQSRYFQHWNWRDTPLCAYFYHNKVRFFRISRRRHDGSQTPGPELVYTVCPKDLLNPNWAPQTLAEAFNE